MTTLSLIPEERRRHNIPQSGSISLDSIHSSTNSKFSANVLNRRKIGSVRQSNLIPMNSEFRQRVVSARVLRMKNLQNQLNDAYHQISELVSENRILRTLHKRQDSALSKYENTNAELPQLLSSHAEEIRVLQSKQKQLQIQNRELNGRLKKKDANLLAITDQNKHLVQLNKDKNLEEREKLTERLLELQQRLVEKDNEYKLLSRRLQLESKGFKTQIAAENHKIKELNLKLEKANLEVQRLTDLADAIERNNKLMSSPYTRAFNTNAPIKSIRNKDQPKMSSNTPINNETIYGSKTFNNSNLALPVFMEKASSSEIIENQTANGKSYKLEKHEFSIRTKNINLPKTDGDARRPNNNDDYFLETETKSKKSEVALLIKNGMAAALSAGSSRSSLSTSQDQYSDYYEDQNDAAEGSHDDDSKSEAPNVQNEYSSSDCEKQDPEDTNNSVIEVKNKIVTNGQEDDEIKCLDKQIEKIQAEIKNELITNEDLLNTYCDDIIKTTNTSSINSIRKLSNSSLSSQGTTAIDAATPTKKPLRNVEINLKPKVNGSVGITIGGNKKQSIDPKKKVKLLAALKAIDSNESFDS